MNKTKSIEKEPLIIPGEYKGIHSGYTLQIIFHTGKKSHPIKLNNGIRGVNFDCKVIVDQEGNIFVEE